MILLLAEEAMPALPWMYVLALCGALGGAIVVMWRRDVGRETDRGTREKEIAAQSRTDGTQVVTALAAAAEQMKSLAAKIEESDEERRDFRDRVLAYIHKRESDR